MKANLKYRTLATLAAAPFALAVPSVGKAQSQDICIGIAQFVCTYDANTKAKYLTFSSCYRAELAACRANQSDECTKPDLGVPVYC